jgi:hypothetical protein
LKGICTLSFLPNDIKDGVDELGTFRVVYRYVSKKKTSSKSGRMPLENCSLTALRPVITRPALAEHEVIRAEKPTQRTRANGIHSSRLEVNQDRPRDILVSANLVIVDGDSFQLKVIVAFVKAVAFDPMLI